MTEIENKSDMNLSEPPKHSFLTMTSYGTGKFLVEFYSAAFSVLIYKYYETNLGLNGWLTGLAIIIYSIWNAINDPIIGYFTIRPTRFAQKYGRRFPWIVLGGGIWVFTLLPIFIVPKTFIENPGSNQGWLFLWLVVVICLHDFFFSIWELNYQSLFPDKFRKEKVRANAAVIATVIGVIGIALGNLMPTFIVDYDYASTYQLNAIIFTIIGIVFFFLMLPGVQEDPDMIERYIAAVEKKAKEEKEDSFFIQLKEAFTHKNFVAFILFYFLYQACTMSMSASVDYVGDYILPGDKSDTTMIFAGMLIGALISVPLWGRIAVRLDSNQKALMWAAVVIIIGLIGMTFTTSYWGYTITITIFGLGFGGYWMLITPVMADVIDEIVVETKVRNDGIFMGFRAFFGRLSYAMQALSFAIVHAATGFVNKSDVEQTSLAKWGIRIHMSVLPMIFMIIGLVIFAKMNTLTPDRVKKIRVELKELNL
ncbi:MFS transporter [Candidatus Harpocratesius sp.]